MNDSVDRAVTRVIRFMYQRIGDELTADELARTAMYSKFHFSRAFREVTGVSPGRFLSALRFQEAKRLLVSTSLSVAEISNRVGYSSLGTFSTRFKSSVGVTPTEYRRCGGRWAAGTSAESRSAEAGSPIGTICGRVSAATTGADGPTFIGLFPDPVPQRPPVRATMLAGPGPYLLDQVPRGSWYVLAHAVGTASDGVPTGSVGQLGPLTVRPGAIVGAVDLWLRPMRAVDLPVLPAPFVIHPPGVDPELVARR